MSELINLRSASRRCVSGGVGGFLHARFTVLRLLASLILRPTTLASIAPLVPAPATFGIGCVSWYLSLSLLIGIHGGSACEPYRDFQEFVIASVHLGLIGAAFVLAPLLLILLGAFLPNPDSTASWRAPAIALLWPVTFAIPLALCSVSVAIWLVSIDAVELARKPVWFAALKPGTFAICFGLMWIVVNYRVAAAVAMAEDKLGRKSR